MNRNTSFHFVSRNNFVDGLGIFKAEYGNYMGATSLFKWDGKGKFTSEYDYSLPAVDAVDNFAKSHDKGYDALGAVGANGLLDDWGTTPVDEAALQGWTTFLSNYDVGDIDPYNNQKVTQEARNAAWRGKTLFKEVVGSKKSAIAKWMHDNYSSEARKPFGNKGVDVDKNYDLFLEKYMDHDKDGNWIRKAGMWSQEGDTWTPIKPNSK